MNVERIERRAELAHRHGQPVTSVATLILVVGTLAGSPYFQPKWTLWAGAAILGLGLAVGGSLGGRVARERAQTATASLAIVVLVVGLAGESPYGSTRWSLLLGVALLGIGLVAGPLARVVRGRPAHLSAQPLASAAALALLVGTLVGSPDWSPRWALWLGAGFLAIGLAVGERIRDRVAQRLAHSATAVAALIVVILGLTDGDDFDTRWPLQLGVLLLVAGLVAALLTQLFGGANEEVLSARVDELSRTRRGALDVQASELRRIERDLHDGAQARLVALSMKLGRAEDRYREDPYTAALLREAREDATAAIRELRELARGIAPPILSDRGLEAAVRSLTERSGTTVTVSGQLARRPAASVETAAYFVVAESLTNAAKHAPGARVEIRVDERGGDLFVEITDFGPGGADATGGGLTGLRQRVEALDGALHVTSPAGVGTQVEAVLPCGW